MSVKFIGNPEDYALPTKIDGVQESSTGPLFVRDLAVAVEHDFDKMLDKVRFYSRAAPGDSLRMAGFTFDKRVTTFYLPERGTPERDGANMALGVLAGFLEDHQQ